ncbi:hypothetical protein E8E12_002629 [Didymella heteroderae]|uniref:CHAT domain-containing protein n=1 Tax=Didymella heteroderae TaxID=1769908 RepID=A0A9P5BYH0_9PLEO|nr:hypothetical protein E8E12_002629 [Didymella heteroderae]
MSSHIDAAPDKAEKTAQPAQDDHQHLLKLRYAEIWFFSRFEKKSAIRDLNHAISVMEKLVDKTSATQDDRMLVVQHFVQLLYKRYGVTRSTSDLNRLIEFLEEVVEATSASDPDHVAILDTFTDVLLKRFDLTHSKCDIDRIIDVLGMKLAATPDDHPNRASRLTDQASMLEKRFNLARSVDDLHKAVSLGSAAISALPEGHYQQTIVLVHYAQTLAKRSTVIGSFHDLNDAIDVCDRAMRITPQWHPDRASCEHTRSNLLHMRFAQTGAKKSLDAAIQMAEIAAMSLSESSPHRFLYRANLAKLLEIRFGERGSLEDLNRAIDLLDDVVDNAPHDSPNKIDNMSALSISLGRRFQEIGSMHDINYAIDLSTRVVGDTSDDDPYYARHLANLGNLAGPRYERTGLIIDLNLAIDVLEKAVILPPHLLTKANAFPYASIGPNSNEGGLWVSLGHWLAERFERTGTMEDLDRSIYVSEQAMAKTPPRDNVNRALHSHHLGRRLVKRFEQTRQEIDIVRALAAARAAVEDTPDEHIYRSAHLSGLANALFVKYKSDGSEEDIEEAIALRLEALELTTTASSLATLGSYYGQRFQRTDDKEHLDDALLYFSSAVTCEDSPPVHRAEAARHAAMILADSERWVEACGFLETVMDLLPHVSPRLLNNSDKQHQLSPFSGLASFAAAVSLQAGNDALHALQLLEKGRGLIGASLLELRSDISKLSDVYPDIAARLEELRNQLDARPDQDDAQSDHLSFGKKTQGSGLSEADEELTNLIVGIRDLPDFDDFLLPPSQKDLLKTSSTGPVVVINMNYYRCDAFLIKEDRIWSIHLPDLKEADINEKVKETDRRKKLDSIQSPDTLKWLWEVAVEPILKELRYTEIPSTDAWPQVWWILTGPLSWLPIHAAGKHAEGKSESTLDRVMSSYSSSVKSLMQGRSVALQDSASPALENALLVAMQHTPGASSLHFAEKEVEMLAALCPSLKLKAVTPSKRCRDQILQDLRGTKIFHFAGHGRLDITDPAQSLLLLDDWQSHPLTVGNLRDLNLHGTSAPFLGFLSACSTSANERIKLVDESIHLAGSLQLAGFRHVIGTLWEVSDSCCVEVAKTVYETIRDEAVALLQD